MIVLVIGGSASGKSVYAETRLQQMQAAKKYYIATMQVWDSEGEKRVQKHRDMRKDKGFCTIEKQRDIAEVVLEDADAWLLECVSNLVANEMFDERGFKAADAVIQKIVGEMDALMKKGKHGVIVTNNIFEDGAEYDDAMQQYLHALGQINQALAQRADEVIEVVAGIPVVIKKKDRSMDI